MPSAMPARIDLPAKAVEAGQHGPAVGEAARVDAVEHDVAAIDGLRFEARRGPRPGSRAAPAACAE